MVTASEAVALGYRARKDGDLSAAREHYTEGARLFREQSHLLACAHAMRHIADIHQQEGNSTEAKPLYEEALEIYRSNLDTKLLDLANTVRPYALLNEQQGHLEAASKLWEEARILYGSLRIDAGVSECEAHITRLKRS
jgi:tetratricopeptide (TPR) repeat protein